MKKKQHGDNFFIFNPEIIGLGLNERARGHKTVLWIWLLITVSDKPKVLLGDLTRLIECQRLSHFPHEETDTRLIKKPPLCCTVTEPKAKHGLLVLTSLFATSHPSV